MELMKQTLALVKRILKKTRRDHTLYTKKYDEAKVNREVKVGQLKYLRGYIACLQDQIEYYEKLREELEASIRVGEQQEEETDDR